MKKYFTDDENKKLDVYFERENGVYFINTESSSPSINIEFRRGSYVSSNSLIEIKYCKKDIEKLGVML